MRYPITSQRLTEAMNDKGINAQELSNKTGINKSSISGYVNGQHTIGNIKALEIGKVLGVSPMWLMEFDSPKYDSFDIEVNNKTDDKILEEKAFELYYKYLSASHKTKKMIDLLLEEGD